MTSAGARSTKPKTWPPTGLTLDVLERQFDRVQAMFPRIDAKINAVFAIASAQIALASLGLSGDNWRRWDILVPAALFVIAIGITLFNLYRCTFPHVKKSGKSLVYFAEIARLSETEAIEAFSSTDTEAFRRDLIVQTWRTSLIATRKFDALGRATFAAMASLIPWVWLLAASSWSS